VDGEGLAAGDSAADGLGLGEGEACGVGEASASVDCNTECVPVTAGSESINATSIKAAAAPIVTFARTVAVPRGPKAVLDRVLENNSPALDLPGCNNTTTTRTRHARMNKPYKM
jgi:hypothetical protein